MHNVLHINNMPGKTLSAFTPSIFIQLVFTSGAMKQPHHFFLESFVDLSFFPNTET